MESFGYIEGFYQAVELVPDDYSIHAAKTKPNDSFFMNGTRLCRGNYPEDFSILIKYRASHDGFSMNFLNISNERHGLAITLDMCSDRLNISFGSACPLSEISFNLPAIYTSGDWHRLGISFSVDAIHLYGDCTGAAGELSLLLDYFPLDLSECQVRPCDDGTNIHILQPTHSDQCGNSDVEVSIA